MFAIRRYIEKNNLYQNVYNLSVACSICSIFGLSLGSILSSPPIIAGSLGLCLGSFVITLYLLETGRVRSGSGNPYDNDAEMELPDE